MLCPICLSDNLDELPDGRYKCLDCGTVFDEAEGEDAEDDEKQERRDNGEEDEEEDSEGDGLMGEGDIMFP